MQILLKNYRAIKQISLNIVNPLHILIGENGSGKSTILEAILAQNKTDMFFVDRHMILKCTT